eukprot:PLAT172.13.p1 GENE.PLAT172.13~~PLAT172.13.p1  ORF type:complete len:1982 (+),score=856.11 PLAT172.13:422-6367(+)
MQLTLTSSATLPLPQGAALPPCEAGRGWLQLTPSALDYFALPASAGCVLLQPQLARVAAATAVIFAPKLIAACEDLRLDGTASSAPGLSTLSYSWSVSRAASIPSSALVNYLTQEERRTAQLVVPAGLLPPGGSLLFTLAVSSSDSAGEGRSSVVVEISTFVAPLQLDLAGPQGGVSLPITDSHLISVRATAVSCTASPRPVPHADVEWTWSMTLGGEQAFLALERPQPNAIRIPAGAVAPGVYQLSLVAVSDGRPGSLTYDFNITAPPLLARVHGGNRVLAQASPFRLDGRASLDRMNEDAPMQFSWTCMTLEQLCPFQANLTDWHSPQGVLDVPADVLNVFQLYIFTLDISKPGPPIRTASTSVEVYAQPGTGADAVIILPDEQFLPVGRTLRLSSELREQEQDGQADGEGEGAETVTRSWQLLEPSPFILTQTPEQLFPLGSARAALLMSPEPLEEHSAFRFRLNAATISSTTRSEVLLAVNAAPAGGFFAVHPRSGQALSTRFALQAGGWTDEADQLPLRYLFARRVTQDTSPHWLQPEPQLGGSTTVLLAGAAAGRPALAVRLGVRVSDVLGAFVDCWTDAQGDEMIAWVAAPSFAGPAAATHDMLDAVLRQVDELEERTAEQTVDTVGVEQRQAFALLSLVGESCLGRSCSGHGSCSAGHCACFPPWSGRECDTLAALPRHGGYSPWTPFTACSRSCGGGRSFRWRTCTQPAPAFGGDDCVGDAVQQASCNLQDCERGLRSANGGWTQWSQWSSCLQNCPAFVGGSFPGVQLRHRSCTAPRPSGTGSDCSGLPVQTRTCAGVICPQPLAACPGSTVDADGGFIDSHCSSHGSCQRIPAGCAAGDDGCSARCLCDEGFAGRDCSLAADADERRRALQARLTALLMRLVTPLLGETSGPQLASALLSASTAIAYGEQSEQEALLAAANTLLDAQSSSEGDTAAVLLTIASNLMEGDGAARRQLATDVEQLVDGIHDLLFRSRLIGERGSLSAPHVTLNWALLPPESDGSVDDTAMPQLQLATLLDELREDGVSPDESDGWQLRLQRWRTPSAALSEDSGATLRSSMLRLQLRSSSSSRAPLLSTPVNLTTPLTVQLATTVDDELLSRGLRCGAWNGTHWLPDELYLRSLTEGTASCAVLQLGRMAMLLDMDSSMADVVSYQPPPLLAGLRVLDFDNQELFIMTVVFISTASLFVCGRRADRKAAKQRRREADVQFLSQGQIGMLPEWPHSLCWRIVYLLRSEHRWLTVLIPPPKDATLAYTREQRVLVWVANGIMQIASVTYFLERLPLSHPILLGLSCAAMSLAVSEALMYAWWYVQAHGSAHSLPRSPACVDAMEPRQRFSRALLEAAAAAGHLTMRTRRPPARRSSVLPMDVEMALTPISAAIVEGDAVPGIAGGTGGGDLEIAPALRRMSMLGPPSRPTATAGGRRASRSGRRASAVRRSSIARGGMPVGGGGGGRGRRRSSLTLGAGGFAAAASGRMAAGRRRSSLSRSAAAGALVTGPAARRRPSMAISGGRRLSLASGGAHALSGLSGRSGHSRSRRRRGSVMSTASAASYTSLTSTGSHSSYKSHGSRTRKRRRLSLLGAAFLAPLPKVKAPTKVIDEKAGWDDSMFAQMLMLEEAEEKGMEMLRTLLLFTARTVALLGLVFMAGGLWMAFENSLADGIGGLMASFGLTLLVIALLAYMSSRLGSGILMFLCQLALLTGLVGIATLSALYLADVPSLLFSNRTAANAWASAADRGSVDVTVGDTVRALQSSWQCCGIGNSTTHALPPCDFADTCEMAARTVIYQLALAPVIIALVLSCLPVLLSVRLPVLLWRLHRQGKQLDRYERIHEQQTFAPVIEAEPELDSDDEDEVIDAVELLQRVFRGALARKRLALRKKELRLLHEHKWWCRFLIAMVWLATAALYTGSTLVAIVYGIKLPPDLTVPWFIAFGTAAASDLLVFQPLLLLVRASESWWLAAVYDTPRSPSDWD